MEWDSILSVAITGWREVTNAILDRGSMIITELDVVRLPVSSSEAPNAPIGSTIRTGIQ